MLCRFPVLLLTERDEAKRIACAKVWKFKHTPVSENPGKDYEVFSNRLFKFKVLRRWNDSKEF